MKGIIGNNMNPAGPAADPAAEDPSGGQVDAAVEDEAEAEDSAGDENNPAFKQALQFAMAALYQNGASKNIAEQIRRSQDIPSALASVAYEIVTVTDERTQGSLPDELLMLFVTYVVEEVVDIARAAGVKVSASDIGQAIKQMILRYLGEQGIDTRELQAAMDKFDTNSLNTMEGDDGAAAQPGSKPAAASAQQPPGGVQQ